MEVKNSQVQNWSEIPFYSYDEFFTQVCELLERESCHCSSYFAIKRESEYALFMAIADDGDGTIHLLTTTVPENAKLRSLTVQFPALHLFEREIAEQTTLRYKDHPWAKPVRYTLHNYPFYSIQGDDLHEVGVGPIHAGVIEPGHFRFICNGEKVLHLEIALGYQHRGVENEMLRTENFLRRQLLCESIAGDTSVAHATAFVQAMEALTDFVPSDRLMVERNVALELERIAMHIADVGALCGDVAYQLGLVVCESLRTLTINSTQYWCGNRFGKGLIRPGGTNYPLTDEVVAYILGQLAVIERRFVSLTDRVFSLPSVLTRFENIGKVSTEQARMAGLVGPSARSAGLLRDIRISHAFGAYTQHFHSPLVYEQGDVWARAMIRRLEVLQSIDVIRMLMDRWKNNLSDKEYTPPCYDLKIHNNSVVVSLVEGWRGEIAHVAITDNEGKLVSYKIKDPSFHNWSALALAMREQQISDFPICNKSFNLSYCGFDL